MEFDEPKSPRRYPCKKCGHSFDAAAPDDIYVIAMRDKCQKCKTRQNRTKVWNYECENCHEMNKIFWHENQQHTIREPVRQPSIHDMVDDQKKDLSRLLGGNDLR